ncbi:MAG: UUP1 family membrane protein [Xanthomonadales bacterium]|nr:UUP1 family membrane protein [Xanthomonadales bacterium]
MKKTQLYLLALILAAIGLGWATYKWQVLKFPLQPDAEVQVWTIQARAEFQAHGGPNTVQLQLPGRGVSDVPDFLVLEERLISRSYGEQITKSRSGRQVNWSVRRARGEQVLYYVATVVRDDHEWVDQSRPRLADAPTLSEAQDAALDAIFDEVKAESADIATFAQALLRKLLIDNDSDEARLLLASHSSLNDKAEFLASALAIRKIPARVVHGLMLGESTAFAEPLPLLQVHNEQRWVTLDLRDGSEGLPENYFLWSRSGKPLLAVESDSRPQLSFSVQYNLADAMVMAKRRSEVRNRDLIDYSLLGLPLDAQSTYRILLMVPIGAFIMLLLRNIVGVKTFGTFMPVLIALAFRETQLIGGVALFTVVVGLGLLVRFYLERLRLLLVPRLTAVLILVVMLMALVSIVSNRMEIQVGLSVALFPMVIMAMTIERMSIAWDERGSSYALKEGIGSLMTACLAYLAMTWDTLEFLIFVYPELLLVLLAVTLLIGRYSGYRLTELLRFRALAVDEPKP